MNWTTETISDRIVHTTTCTDTLERDIQVALNVSADYAFTLLDECIGDDAMYCLFIWDDNEKSLTVAVTDETKTKDGKHLVTVSFSGFGAEPSEDRADTVKYWLTDHLTTSQEFLKYSLIAGFVRGERDRVELM